MIPPSPWRQQGFREGIVLLQLPGRGRGGCCSPGTEIFPPPDEAEDHLISRDWMNTKCSSWRGQELETRVVPDGFLHPGAAFSRFEGERANLEVHEKPRVQMRLKSHRNGKIETTCVSKRSPEPS